MAKVLKTAKRAATSWWAVDKMILGYFAFSIVLLIGWWSRIPNAPALLTWHVAGGLLVVFQVKRPNPTSWFFRNWYPLPYVASSYKEMAVFMRAVRQGGCDRWLADLDFRIWHANPTVWLERIQSPALTEFLQAAYTLFVPGVLLVAFLLWKKRYYAEFQYYAFLIALGFLVSYMGYLIVPAGDRVSF